MRLLFVTLTAFMLHLSAFAQPGYQGRKLIVGYDFGISPALLFPNYKGNNGLTSFNTFHSGKVEYVVSREASVGLEYTFARTGLDYELDVFGKNIYEDNPLKLSTNALNFKYKIINAKCGTIAPIGRYTELGVGVINLLVHDDLSKEDLSRSNKIMFSVGFGKQKVIYNYLMMNIGMEFGIIAGPMMDAVADVGGDDGIERDAGIRAMCQNMLKVKIGLSYLAK